MKPLGRQLLAEFYGCDPERLSDPEFVARAMLKAARESGATIVTHSFHHFAPLGVSGVVIISESHLAIHTWPEHGFAAADYFTCGSRIAMEKGIELLRETLGAQSVEIQTLERGMITPSATPFRG
jgi:S-adenosylmethionine decarboxylase